MRWRLGASADASPSRESGVACGGRTRNLRIHSPMVPSTISAVLYRSLYRLRAVRDGLTVHRGLLRSDDAGRSDRVPEPSAPDQYPDLAGDDLNGRREAVLDRDRHLEVGEGLAE